MQLYNLEVIYSIKQSIGKKDKDWIRTGSLSCLHTKYILGVLWMLLIAHKPTLVGRLDKGFYTWENFLIHDFKLSKNSMKQQSFYGHYPFTPI